MERNEQSAYKSYTKFTKIKHEDTSFKMCCTTHVMLLKNKQEHKILLKEFIQGRNISIRQDRSNSKD